MENKQNAKSPRKLSAVLMSLLLVAVIALNIGCAMFSNVITQFFSTSNADSAEVARTHDMAEELVERIAGEGIVLLRNEKDALPLSDAETKLNLFGWSSYSPMISGGIGSGAGNTDNTLDFVGAMREQGFQLNEELVDFYTGLGYSRNVKNSFGEFEVDYTKTEAPLDAYSDELWSNAKDFSDVALVMYSRIGNEADDLPTDMSALGGRADEHYLELSDKEEALLDKVLDMGFQKVIVLINAGYPFEAGFLEEKGVDAALWVGGPGQTGMNSVARILKGEIVPSGRTVDTFAYDLTSAPAYQNFGEFYYEGESYTAMGYDGEETRNYNYVEYAEGIYVGYRYFETRWVDNATGVCDEAAYRKAVQYPFGYGLSYTTFDQEISSFRSDDVDASMTVTVTNTGSMAGKEVVQVYVTAPYYPGGIEKSHVSLIGFGKTEVLQPGESQDVEIGFTLEDLASFDYVRQGCYVLDKGTYQIKLMRNAHDVIDQRELAVADTVVYDQSAPRSTDQQPAVSLFHEAQGSVAYMTRSDWEGTWPTDVAKTRVAEPELIAQLKSTDPDPRWVDQNAAPIVIKDNGLKLKDMIGLPYDDPKWELLLQQLSVKDMQHLIGLGGYATQIVDSVGKPYTIDLDGPTGILALVNAHAYEGVLYPTAVVAASTWNVELLEEMGDVFSQEAVAWGISGIYGPSMNIHRNPFGGRNYEYYSEDGFLSGKMAAGIVRGFNKNNVYCYIKHFAAYDQAENPFGLATWSNEQALREIYFKPFELAVKEGGARALMSSYNRVGAVWSGANYPLLTDLLRGEWGFRGMVITDWFSAPPMDPEQGIFAGNDLMLATTAGAEPLDTSNAGQQAMRKACHNVLYTVANSVAMDYNDFGPTPYWLYALVALDVVVAALEAVFFSRWNKKRKETAVSKES